MNDVFYSYTATAAVLMAIVAILVYLFLSSYIHHLQAKKPFENLPVAANSHWFFGHVKILFDKHNFPENLYKVVRDSANEQGRTGIWLGNKRTISFLRLDDARTILQVESHRTSVPIVSRYLAKIIGPNNILFLNGRKWRQNRDAVTRTFVPSFLLRAQQDVAEVSQTLTTTLDRLIAKSNKNDDSGSGKECTTSLDVQPIMKMVTMDVIGKAAFSYDFECCKNFQPSPVVQAFESLTRDLTLRLSNPVHPKNYFYSLPTAQNKEQRQQLAVLNSFIHELLSQAQAQANSSSSSSSTVGEQLHEEGNLLTRLVAAHRAMNNETNKDGASLEDLADSTLRDVMATLLFASYDTTSTTLMFCLYLLAKNPEIQQACVQEVCSVAATQNAKNATLSNPDELVYCAALVQETLRLYPPAFTVSRTLTKPVTLSDGFVVPQGAHANIPIWVIQRDETLFPDPSTCLPERWVQWEASSGRWTPRNVSNDNNDSGHRIAAGNPQAILAFSGGGRKCPGAKFALQEAVLVLANLVKEFRFSLVPNFELKLQLEGILSYPVGGMPLRIQKR